MAKWFDEMNDEEETTVSSYTLYIRPVIVLEEKTEYEWTKYKNISALNNEDLLQKVKEHMGSFKFKKDELNDEVYRFDILGKKEISAYFEIKAVKEDKE